MANGLLIPPYPNTYGNTKPLAVGLPSEPTTTPLPQPPVLNADTTAMDTDSFTTGKKPTDAMTPTSMRSGMQWYELMSLVGGVASLASMIRSFVLEREVKALRQSQQTLNALLPQVAKLTEDNAALATNFKRLGVAHGELLERVILDENQGAFLGNSLGTMTQTLDTVDKHLNLMMGALVETVEEQTALTRNLRRTDKKFGDLLATELEQVKQELGTVATESKQALELIKINPTTGLGTKKALEIDLPMAILDTANTQEPVVVFFFDGDNFGGINSTCGHDDGDRIIGLMGQIVDDSLRTEQDQDKVYQGYSPMGDEFLAVCKAVTPEQAKIIGNRIVQNFDTNVPLIEAVKALGKKKDTTLPKVTVSVGSITLAPLSSELAEQLTPQEVKQLADAMKKIAEYSSSLAKIAGKNNYKELFAHPLTAEQLLNPQFMETVEAKYKPIGELYSRLKKSGLSFDSPEIVDFLQTEGLLTQGYTIQ